VCLLRANVPVLAPSNKHAVDQNGKKKVKKKSEENASIVHCKCMIIVSYPGSSSMNAAACGSGANE